MKKGCEYKFYTEFQSHEPEFDYLKSLEIEEKINKIKWCKRQNAAHFLLSTMTKQLNFGRCLKSPFVWYLNQIITTVLARSLLHQAHHICGFHGCHIKRTSLLLCPERSMQMPMHIIYIQFLSTLTKKRISPPTIYGSTCGTSTSVTKALISLTSSL